MLRAFQGFRACPENRHIKQLGRCKILDTLSQEHSKVWGDPALVSLLRSVLN